MKTIDLTPVIQAVIALISSLITVFIIPKLSVYLKAKLSGEQRKELNEWIKIAVGAAEQLYGSKTGQQKKEFVVSYLLSKGIVIDIDDVTAMIEKEVYKLSQINNSNT